MPNTLAIIVTYNGEKWIRQCLDSLRNQTVQTDVLIVDNNSSDKTIFLIKEHYPAVKMVVSQENLGFGKANNLGFIWALHHNYSAVLLLNQDAFIENNAIQKLEHLRKKYIGYAIISPMQLDIDGKHIEHKFINFLTRTNLNKEIVSDFFFNKKKEIYDIEFIQAAIWYMPIDTIKAIGGFDPVFFHYGEDRDYCLRLNNTKLRIGVTPDILGYHAADNYLPQHLTFLQKVRKNALISKIYIIYNLKHYKGFFFLKLVIEFAKIFFDLILDTLNRSWKSIPIRFYLIAFLFKWSLPIYRSRRRQKVDLNYLNKEYDKLFG